MNLPILMYHRIGLSAIPGSDLTVTVQAFTAQIKYLKRKGYQPVWLSALAKACQGQAQLPKKPIVLTFDDALVSVLKYAKPVLDAAGFFGTVFVVSRAVGRSNFWDRRASLPAEDCLDKEGLLRLADYRWEIGAHSATHADLTQASAEDLKQETQGAKLALEEGLGLPVESFCYPFGAWNVRVQQAVRSAGFCCACAVSPGTPSVTADLYALRRIYVKPGDSLLDFKRKISTWYLAYRAWRRR